MMKRVVFFRGIHRFISVDICVDRLNPLSNSEFVVKKSVVFFGKISYHRKTNFFGLLRGKYVVKKCKKSSARNQPQPVHSVFLKHFRFLKHVLHPNSSVNSNVHKYVFLKKANKRPGNTGGNILRFL